MLSPNQSHLSKREAARPRALKLAQKGSTLQHGSTQDEGPPGPVQEGSPLHQNWIREESQYEDLLYLSKISLRERMWPQESGLFNLRGLPTKQESFEGGALHHLKTC
ncbi:UNVERIFIED_CONTAM: hypothetical protein Sindi_2556500 [Sesamum indicum]